MVQWLSVTFTLLLVVGYGAVAALLKSSGHQEAHSLLKLVSQRAIETTELAQRLSGHQGEWHPKTRSSVQLAQSRDLQHKDKIIKHLTGPLYVNPKCRSHFNRLYHIRECVVPAYFKRCARLLTRLANSLRCAER
ncbi:ALK and LTK ligand 2b [Vanacampus margaritifer]